MEPSTEELSLEDAIHREFNRFRGRCAGFIEALNLSPRQERGLVSNMKSFSYDTERDVIKHAQRT